MKTSKFQTLLMWIFLKINRPKYKKGAKNLDWYDITKMNMEQKKAILIFELGSLQVFHYQTPNEAEFNAPVKEVYWQDKNTKQIYGAFPTVYDAMTHYKWVKSIEKGDKRNAKIIRYDFKKKKRLISEEI